MKYWIVTDCVIEKFDSAYISHLWDRSNIYDSLLQAQIRQSRDIIKTKRFSSKSKAKHKAKLKDWEHRYPELFL